MSLKMSIDVTKYRKSFMMLACLYTNCNCYFFTLLTVISPHRRNKLSKKKNTNMNYNIYRLIYTENTYLHEKFMDQKSLFTTKRH